MDTGEFKKMFGEIAKENGFERAYEGWFREFDEVIHVLDLQKSNFGCYYYLNIKLFIQGVFGNIYVKSKKLVKTDCGNIFLRQPNNYSKLLNLDIELADIDRKEGLKEMFRDFIVPFSSKTSTKTGIKKLHEKGELFILPAVKQELDF
ncbi:MAG: DUF4304 domain-containing protein [Chlamydiae bacterium]|nr:DUF4304 domain-containing protein [Chlamydiota bacterium]